MHHRSLPGFEPHGFGAASSSLAAGERRPAFMAWFAVAAGVAICAVAALLV